MSTNCTPSEPLTPNSLPDLAQHRKAKRLGLTYLAGQRKPSAIEGFRACDRTFGKHTELTCIYIMVAHPDTAAPDEHASNGGGMAPTTPSPSLAAIIQFNNA